MEQLYVLQNLWTILGDNFWILFIIFIIEAISNASIHLNSQLDNSMLSHAGESVYSKIIRRLSKILKLLNISYTLSNLLSNVLYIQKPYYMIFSIY